MNKKIYAFTSMKPIRKKTTERPLTPVFIFRNDGTTMAFIGDIRLFPGEVFGVDNTSLVVAGLMATPKIFVEEATDYTIDFGTDVVDISRGGVLIQQVTLIQTKYTTEGF